MIGTAFNPCLNCLICGRIQSFQSQLQTLLNIVNDVTGFAEKLFGRHSFGVSGQVYPVRRQSYPGTNNFKPLRFCVNKPRRIVELLNVLNGSTGNSRARYFSRSENRRHVCLRPASVFLYLEFVPQFQEIRAVQSAPVWQSDHTESRCSKSGL